MKRLVYVCMTVLLVCLASVAFCADSPMSLPKDYWMGIYSDTAKIGYAHTVIKNVNSDVNDITQREDTLVIRVMDGTTSATYQWNQVINADALFKSASRRLQVCCPDNTTERKATFTCETKDHQYTCVLDGFSYEMENRHFILFIDGFRGRGSTSATLSDDELKYDRESVMYELGQKSLQVGDKFSIDLPLWTISGKQVKEIKYGRNNSSIEVLRRERIQVDGISYNALVLKRRYKQGEFLTWCLDSGDVIKEEHCGYKIAFVREPKERATRLPN